MSMLEKKAPNTMSEKSVKSLGGSELEAEDSVSEILKIPEEAWLTLFEKLDVKDQLTCLRTCPEWKKWLSHKQTILLLPQIAHLVLDRVRSTSDMLNLRVVGKSWKEAVDRFNAPYGTIVRCNEFRLDAEEEFYLGLQVSFNYNEDIQGFMEDMKSHNGNPFPGRIVGFCPVYEPANTVEDSESNSVLSRGYWNNVKELLKKFGSHLNVAGFIMTDIDFFSHGINEIGKLIGQCFISLQNVKHLQIVIDAYTERAHFFDEEPLPPLCAVETLDLKVCNPYLLTVLLESCCIPANIKRLQFVHHGRHSRIPDVVYQFSNLEVLRVAISCDSDLHRFKSLQQPMPLQEIQFIFEKNNPEIDLIFTCLDKFKNTLVHANLIFLGIPTPEYISRQKAILCNGMKLNLPKLKKLTVFGYNGPLDPFVELNSLVNFEMHTSGNLWKWEESVVDFLGFESQMYESNIWHLMPSLNRFVYSAYKGLYVAPLNPISYNREGLEQHRSNNGNL